MKRWQDRGEVLDSDEEVLEFSNHSQSPEQPRKRQRLDNSAEEVPPIPNKLPSSAHGARSRAETIPGTDGGEHLPADATPGTAERLQTGSCQGERRSHDEYETKQVWTQPKAAASYERQFERSRPTSRQGRVLTPDDKTMTAASSLKTSTTQACPATATAAQDENGTAVVYLPSPVNGAFEGNGTPGARSRLAGLVAEDDMHLEQPAPTEEPLFAPSSPMTSEDESLPDLSQVFRGNNYRPQTPEKGPQGNLSALSSPPSSPEPPAHSCEFRLPRSPTGTELPHALDTSVGLEVHRDSPDLQDLEHLNVLIPVDTSDIASPNIGGIANDGKRSLRTRTEKQLHPYVYDRTIYQQQFKQRGLRPVHFVMEERRAQETQDHSYETDDSRSQEQNQYQDSSPTKLGSGLTGSSISQSRPGRTKDKAGSGDELPDIDSVFSRTLSRGVQDGHKRRKTLHLPRPGQLKSTGHREPQQVSPALRQDASSVPISPPPTSSDSSRQRVAVVLPSGFRLPVGMTPAALSTPQISSETRPLHIDADASDSDVPASGPRRSNLRRAPSHAVAVDSTTESESEPWIEVEQQPDIVDDRRLQRERKRIRGVLPASWLRIDIRAQQKPSSSVRARQMSATPAATECPAKGVAQRISKRPDGTSSRGSIIDIGDSGDDDSPSPARSSKEVRQRRFCLHRDHRSTARDTAIDDEGMEMDWIDPMVVDNPRRRRSDLAGRKQQPKIKDALSRSRDASNDFSEERAGLRLAREVGNRHRRARTPLKARHAPPLGSSRPPAPRLSILDAPNSPDPRSPAPQFIRLAQRQARQQTDLGRHSPSHKVIRLATQAETLEASELLTAWREGTIKPRATLELVSEHHSPKRNMPSTSHGRAFEDTGSTRPPLLDVTNQQNIQARSRQLLRPEGAIGKTISRSHLSMAKPASFQADRESPCILETPIVRSTEIPRLEVTRLEGKKNKPRPRYRDFAQDGRTRGAQMEALEKAFDKDHRSAAFQRHMNILTEGVTRPLHVSKSHALPLHRFLESSSSMPSPMVRTRNASQCGAYLDRAAWQREHPTRQTRLTHRPRKRPPMRINAECREYRQPSEPLPEPILVEDALGSGDSKGHNTAVLQGLGPFGTRYATDFDIQPLELGTHFHQSTFVGSGDLNDALQLGNRDLDIIVRGHMRVFIDEEVCEWGAWTEDVADGLAKVPRAVIKAFDLIRVPDESTSRDVQLPTLTANIDHMLRSVVRYCSRVLVFLDPVDRKPCVQHLLRLADDLLDALDGPEASNIDLLKVNAMCLGYILVLASQACILAQHHHVSSNDQEKSRAVKSKAAMRLSACLGRFVFGDLPAFYDNKRHSLKRECGVCDDERALAGVVLVNHCLRSEIDLTFWNVIRSTSAVQPQTLSTVQRLEQEWYRIFALLPALEVNSMGETRPGSRLQSTQQDWHMIRALVDRLLELYPATMVVSGTTVNAYLRATFTRCYHLINYWGWRQCEVILGTVFDFFARRMLAPLTKEETHGSPLFLADLENRPSLDVQPEDRSFTICLKMLASGLLNMQKDRAYSDRRVGSIAWRFVPNHSRSYQKEKSVERSDLDALRNHHDLLCTLYFACPAGHRIRLDSVRNIVDHSTWHREACRISVRAWANLASFQASTDEPAESLQPFMDWFQDIMTATTSQYRLAKTEAEADFARAEATGAVGITDALLNSTIAVNQRHIAATLVDALAGLKRALRAARTLSVALRLVESSCFWKPFVPFDAGERRLYSALKEVVEVVKTAIEVKTRLCAPPHGQYSSEGSQDYGDVDGLEELAGTGTVGRPTGGHLIELLHEPLAQLMSNVFGADQAIDEDLLTELIDVWVRLASESTHSGLRSWGSYLEQYSAHSWHQLRYTDQKRKYTPYFLARVVEEAGRSLQDAMPHVLEAWLVCLVEREATLKYQHRLTSSLLETFGDHPMMENLPFIRDSKTGLYDISLHVFRQRRLGLIVSLLSNMRTNMESLTYQRSQQQEAERMYSNLVRAMMQSMKSNYQEMRTADRRVGSEANLRGAYVDFVQQVVTFLHAASIVKIDNFFTDSSVFPLPASDPTYVVGRLKAYVPKLANLGAQKALAIAIQSISERAAIDGQHSYLVRQLVSAMDEGAELGSQTRPSLRHVMLTAILPAYVAQALSTTTSWILAVPILEACMVVTGGLLHSVRLGNDSSVRAVIEIAHMTLIALLEPLHFAVDRVGRLRLPHVQNILAHVFDVGRSLLRLCGHLKRSRGSSTLQIEALDNMRAIALEVRSQLTGDGEAWFTGLPHNVSAPASDPWAEARHYARAALAKSFETEWSARDGRYVLKKHGVPKEVEVHLRSDEAEQQALLTSVTRFVEGFEIVIDGRRRNRRGAAGDAGSSMLDGVMI